MTFGNTQITPPGEKIITVLVSGGRDFSDVDFIYRFMEGMFIGCKYKSWILVHGGASGVDTICAKWAELHNIIVKEYPANWKKFGKSAGRIRNQEMFDSEFPDIGFIFPGGKGTAHMKSVFDSSKLFNYTSIKQRIDEETEYEVLVYEKGNLE